MVALPPTLADSTAETNFMSRLPRSLRLLVCGGGMMTFFLVYGLTQEKLMTTSYDGELFTDTALLVFINRIVAIIVALCMIMSGDGESLRPVAPLRLYAFISLSNFMSTFCQYEALKYVTFPTQTLGKCGKMIPVLLIGSLIQKKAYSMREYGVAFMVTLGCTIFLVSGQVSSHKSAAAYDTPFGLCLLLVYLASDGFTSTTQEQLFKSYKTSTNNQMLYVNISSAFLSLIALAVPRGLFTPSAQLESPRLFESISFAVRHPQMLSDAVLLSLCSSLGQLIIYYTIKEFGALIYSTIMTTRQFFGILLSAVIFAHPITIPQWLGAVIVFGSIYYKSIMKKDKKSNAKKVNEESGDLTEVLIDDDNNTRTLNIAKSSGMNLSRHSLV